MTCSLQTDEVLHIELPSEVAFAIQCDDGRYLLICGQYCERYQLPEILRSVAAQLPNCSVEIPRKPLFAWEQ
jgi:hypothetical protein